LREILTHNFLGIDAGLKLFFICTLEMVAGPLWKYSTYTLQLLLASLWKQGTVLTHCNRCLRPLWKQGT